MTYLGMDVDVLDTVVRDLRRSVDDLRYTHRQVDHLSDRLEMEWKGNDSRDFRGMWTNTHSPRFLTAIEELVSVVEALRAQVREQRAVSTPSERDPNTLYLSEIPDGALTVISNDGPEGFQDDHGRNRFVEHSRLFVTVPLEDKDLTMAAVGQGQLGDCWLMAALGVVAENDPQFIRDHIRQNDDGTWTVTIYDNGKPVDVNVGMTVSKNAAHNSEGKVSFVSLYERAVAEHFGSYEKTAEGHHSGDAFALITGTTVEPTRVSDLASLQRQLESGPVTVGTYHDANQMLKGVSQNHAYMVDQVELHYNPSTGRDEPMVHLINPWAATDEGDRGEAWLTEEEYQRTCAYSFGATRSAYIH